jgi:hypothetical protein
MVTKFSQNHTGKIANISFLRSDAYRSRILIYVHDSPKTGAVPAYNASAAVFGRVDFILCISGSYVDFAKRVVGNK